MARTEDPIRMIPGELEIARRNMPLRAIPHNDSQFLPLD
jgi:hypothetical protein